MTMASTLTLPQLETHLWGAANLLRGRIDSSDFKHFIFGRRLRPGRLQAAV